MVIHNYPVRYQLVRLASVRFDFNYKQLQINFAKYLPCRFCRVGDGVATWILRCLCTSARKLSRSVTGKEKPVKLCAVCGQVDACRKRRAAVIFFPFIVRSARQITGIKKPAVIAGSLLFTRTFNQQGFQAEYGTVCANYESLAT